MGRKPLDAPATVRLEARVDPEFRRLVHIAAAEDGWTVQDVVVMAVSEWLNRRKSPSAAPTSDPATNGQQEEAT